MTRPSGGLIEARTIFGGSVRSFEAGPPFLLSGRRFLANTPVRARAPCSDMHRIACISVLVSLWGCATEALQDLRGRCPTPHYIDSETLSGPWHYRVTLLRAGAFDGQGSLQRGTLEILEQRLHVVVGGDSVASWPIRRRLDLVCTSGAVQEQPTAQGRYLDVDWQTQAAARQVTLPLEASAAFEPSGAPGLTWTGSGVELTELGGLTVDPATCASAEQALGRDVPCTYRARLRQALSPVRHLDLEGQEHSGAFAVNTRNGYATRAAAVPTYYLPPEAPAHLVEAAQAAAQTIRSVLPDFEILENQCNPEEVQAVLARTEASAVSGPLSEQCDALQRLFPDEFQWQRPGGLRFNTITLTSGGERTGWGTYAATAVDPQTAEIVAADLYLDFNDLEHIADRVRIAAAHPGFEPLLSIAAARTQALLQDSGRTPLSVARVDEPRTPLALTSAAAQARAAQLLHIADDLAYAALAQDPPWRGEALSPNQRTLAELDTRVVHMLAARPRQDAAQWMRSGHSFLGRWQHPGHGLTASTLSAPPEDAARIVQHGLLQHRLLHGLLKAMGLADNPAGSSNDDYAVLDLLPAEHQHEALSLGPYETAALSALYLGADPQSPLSWCSIEAAMSGPSVDCAIDDWGQSAQASVAHAYGRWLAHYPLTHTELHVDHRPSGVVASRPALDVLWRGSLAAQEFAAAVSSDPAFANSVRGLDLSVAARIAANFGAEVIALPRPGRHCAVPGGDPEWLVPAAFAGDLCDPNLPVDDPIAVSQGQVEVLDGLGRDYGLTRPAMDSAWVRVGATIDQANALWGMIISFPSGYEEPAANVGLVDVVPEVSGLYDRLIASNPYFLGSTDAAAVGSRWCAELTAPKLVELTTGAATSAACQEGRNAVLSINLDYNHVQMAVFLTQVMTPHRRLDFYKVGVDDQAIDWSLYTPTELCSFVDDDGAEWRGVWAHQGPACHLLQQAQEAQDYYLDRPEEFYRRLYEHLYETVDAAHRLGALAAP